MSKKNTGLLIAFGAALGAAAACVSYYLKYKSFSDELDKDFHDYEDEDEPSAADGEKAAPTQEASKRNYITIDSGKCKCPENAEDIPQKEDGKKEPEADAETGSGAQKVPSASEASQEKSTADVTVEEDTEGTEA